MRTKFLFLPFILLMAALTIAGCSGDDDDGGGANGGDSSSEPTASAPADSGDVSGDDGDSSVSLSPGTGIMTIRNQSWEIAEVGCAFHPEAGNADVSFNVHGFGESSNGSRLQLNANILDPSGEGRTEGEGVTHNILWADIGDVEAPSVSWQTIDDDLIQTGEIINLLVIDGPTVYGRGTFDDTTTTEEIEHIGGTFEAECP